jgi:hypothetical protein
MAMEVAAVVVVKVETGEAAGHSGTAVGASWGTGDGAADGGTNGETDGGGATNIYIYKHI